MSLTKEQIDALATMKVAMEQWAQMFNALNAAVPAYSSFLHSLYMDLRSKGIPGTDAATMAVQTLPFHIQLWLQKKENTEDPAMAILKKFAPKGGQ